MCYLCVGQVQAAEVDGHLCDCCIFYHLHLAKVIILNHSKVFNKTKMDYWMRVQYMKGRHYDIFITVITLFSSNCNKMNSQTFIIIDIYS